MAVVMAVVAAGVAPLVGLGRMPKTTAEPTVGRFRSEIL